MSNKKLIREKMRIDAIDVIIRNKKEILVDLIKVQEKMEFLTSKLDVLDKYDNLLSKREMTEKEIEETVYNIISNNTDKNIIHAILCSEINIPEHLMDRMINELVIAKKWDLIKSIITCRDDLSTEYIDKLESYLVANELSKKSNSGYDDSSF